MKSINTLLDAVRQVIRSFMRQIARGLNTLTGGGLHPNAVTFTGLLAHIPIAWLIATTRHNIWAAVLVIIFGLCDTLDGELARLQNRTSLLGMFIDSATDRMKEVILYLGIVAALMKSNSPGLTVIIAVGALGASLCTSYMNAWGDAVLASSKQHISHKANKSFRSGLLGFELRISLIIIGLLTNHLALIIYVILVLATLTVFQRFLHIVGRLKHVQS